MNPEVFYDEMANETFPKLIMLDKIIILLVIL